jgi:hypothetical protein
MDADIAAVGSQQHAEQDSKTFLPFFEFALRCGRNIGIADNLTVPLTLALAIYVGVEVRSFWAGVFTLLGVGSILHFIFESWLDHASKKLMNMILMQDLTVAQITQLSNKLNDLQFDGSVKKRFLRALKEKMES